MRQKCVCHRRAGSGISANSPSSEGPTRRRRRRRRQPLSLGGTPGCSAEGFPDGSAPPVGEGSGMGGPPPWAGGGGAPWACGGGPPWHVRRGLATVEVMLSATAASLQPLLASPPRALCSIPCSSLAALTSSCSRRSCGREWHKARGAVARRGRGRWPAVGGRWPPLCALLAARLRAGRGRSGSGAQRQHTSAARARNMCEPPPQQQHDAWQSRSANLAAQLLNSQPGTAQALATSIVSLTSLFSAWHASTLHGSLLR